MVLESGGSIQALGDGLEDQSGRVRTASGRVVSGRAAGERPLASPAVRNRARDASVNGR